MAAIDPKLTQAAGEFAKKKASAKSVAGEAPAKSKGDKLDSKTAKAMEEAFGKKLGDVKIHVGKEAAEAAKGLGAKAFTSGNDIFFASASHAKDPKLLAHALAHVVQQGGKITKGKVNVIK